MKKLFAIFLILAMLLAGCAEPGGATLPCDHTDRNDDGRCDSCTESVLVALDFYSINDLHGKLDDGDSHVGVDELTTYLKQLQEKENAIFLSAGDMWQGSPESNLTQGLIITDWMNELDFAAMTLGNHEFDWGEAAIEANAEAAEFPLLAINVYDRTTNTLVEYCQSSAMVEIAGVQIGIIGAIGDCYSSIASDKVADVYFKTGAQLTALVKTESEHLREHGADLIVYVLHDGNGTNTSGTVTDGKLASYYDISLSDGYVDLVFEGHTHKGYSQIDSHGVYHLQHKGDNSGGISHAEITINYLTGTYRVTEANLIRTAVYSGLEDDPIVDDLLKKYEQLIGPADKVLGTNKYLRNSKQLRQTVADLYFQLGQETWGEQYDITLGGGFISVRSPYDLKAGDVTYGDLQSLFPFDNDIVLCSIKGSDLLSKFINTSNSNYYISGNYGSIDPNRTYYVVVDTYTATYAPNRLTIVERYTPGIYARDLLADFIEAGGFQ